MIVPVSHVPQPTKSPPATEPIDVDATVLFGVKLLLASLNEVSLPSTTVVGEGGPFAVKPQHKPGVNSKTAET